jgi:pyruvate dehydrogenase E1 component alpha subunit
MLFLCENNLYSTHSPLSVRQPPSPIVDRVRLPEMETIQIDGNDTWLVYETLSKAVAAIRKTSKPVFVECLTYRVREHVGPLFDYDRGYRSKEEVEDWMSKCPVKRFSSQLIAQGIMSAGEIKFLEDKWQRLSDEAYAKALLSPWPSADTLLDNVY